MNIFTMQLFKRPEPGKPIWHRIAALFIALFLILVIEICWSINHPMLANADTGIATFYTEASCKAEGNSGVYTQNGERFDEQAFTCALPIRLKRFTSGKNYIVTNLDNGKSIEVRHNDYGPGKGPRKRGVVIDLTPAAFEALGGKITTLKSGRQVGELRNVGVMEIIEDEETNHSQMRYITS